jgi:SAM-dependent methyltransferase
LRERHSFDRAASFVAAQLDEIRASRATAHLSPLPTSATAATQEAVRYLTEGPSVPIRAPSRFGSIGVFGRRLVYRFLRPYISRQREFEHSVVRALAEVEDIAHRRSRAVAQTAREAVKTAERALDRTDREQTRKLELESWAERREDRLAKAESGIAEARSVTQQLDARLYARPYVADPQQLMTTDDAGRPAMGYRDGSRNGPLYLGFEEIFRGSEDFIRERHRSYVDLLASHSPVLDVGSGRGELLELLKEAGVEARGIDLDPAMVERAREKGVVVEEADAISYLESQPPHSLGAIAAIHVIEHLPYENLLRFFELARERLVPGGVLLFETVNPHALEAFKAFWVDPTHRAPIFPEVAIALCRLTGFESAVVTFPNGSGELERDRREQGEYAVVATRQR